ncbi:MAG: hypothetical protein JSU72_05060, partial [Deltaproteobacteria bacterium]
MMRITNATIKSAVLFLVLFSVVSCARVPVKEEAAPAVTMELKAQQAAQRLAKAEESFQQGNLDEATNRYRELIETFPQ